MLGELQTSEVAGNFVNRVHRNLNGEIWAQHHFCSGQHSVEYMEAPAKKDPNWMSRIGVGMGLVEPS